jgi:L-iditol 2-dehydrogenase
VSIVVDLSFNGRFFIQRSKSGKRCGNFALRCKPLVPEVRGVKAAVLHGREDIRIEQLPERPLGEGEVRVDIRAALTCGTDLKVYRRGYHARMLTPPCVFGHEMAGVIRESRHSGWKPGQRVVAANSAPCGTCFSCTAGQPNLCDDLLFLNGAYAESIIVPARIASRNLLELKPDTAFADAALTEPLACVVQGVEDLRLKSGESVLVLGAGPIGLFAIALARQAGCDVTVAGRGAARLALAAKLGASRVIDMAGSEDLVGAVRADGSRRYDVIFEAVGKPSAWEAAVQLVRKGGRVNFFGGCPGGTSVSLDTTLIHYSNLTLLASFHHTPDTIRKALGWIESGVIRAADFVDGTAVLDEVPALFRSMATGNRAVKTLVTPG